MGHGFELLGIVVVAVPVALDLRRSAQSRPLVGDLCGADLVQGRRRSSAHTSARSHSALARKDEYTEEHTRRVALRAVQVGEVLGLTPAGCARSRPVALVHDIGKLSVPERSCRNRARSPTTEFAVIKQHP